MNKAHTILVIDDDPELSKYLGAVVKTAGFDIILASTGLDALKAFDENITGIILDLSMPKMDGIEACQVIRKDLNITQPIIAFLTSRAEDYSQIAGFEAGADDYMVKPFSPKELEARIKAILRRVDKFSSSSTQFSSGVISVGSIKIDTNRRQVYKHSEKIRLTGMEFSLLELLISRSGEPFSRASILQEVWGYTPERHVDTRVVDVHISRLRSKLEEDPSNPDLILTARGTGYLFQKITDSLKYD